MRSEISGISNFAVYRKSRLRPGALLARITLGAARLVQPPIVSVVSIDRRGDDNRPTRDAGAMASRRLSPLLALEIPQHGRGRPPIDAGLRTLIRRMSTENMLWGAPRIQGELLRHYNKSRTHRALSQDAPVHRAIERLGAITSRPVLGGLHHQYCRI